MSPISNNTISIRKSNRTRTLSEKASLTNNKPIVNNNNNNNDAQPKQKKRKLSIEEEEKQISKDKIDPVEKLLSLTNMNYDFLSDLESETEAEGTNHINKNNNQRIKHEDYDEDYDEEPKQIASVNFTKILQDNIRQYYIKKLQNQYNDSFALLNKKKDDTIDNKQQHESLQQQSQSNNIPTNNTNIEVPFFKNVNFGQSKEYSIEDYFSYEGEDEDEEKSTTNNSESEEDISSPISSPTTSSTSLYIPKINNLYRHQSFNFAYESTNNNNSTSNHIHNNINDVSKILNKNSIITGKASEMVSTGNFMINDFYL